jgi:hypothetical protein
VGGGGVDDGMAAAPSRASASGLSLNACSGANGDWKVVPPSRLNESVIRSVASSNDIRSTMRPVIVAGFTPTYDVTGGSWLPSGNTRSTPIE